MIVDRPLNTKTPAFQVIDMNLRNVILLSCQTWNAVYHLLQWLTLVFTFSAQRETPNKNTCTGDREYSMLHRWQSVMLTGRKVSLNFSSKRRKKSVATPAAGSLGIAKSIKQRFAFHHQIPCSCFIINITNGGSCIAPGEILTVFTSRTGHFTLGCGCQENLGSTQLNSFVTDP